MLWALGGQTRPYKCKTSLGKDCRDYAYYIRKGSATVKASGPDRSVKLDDLRRGKALPRRYRNRRIGEFLEELELTEGRGTGVPKIIRTMRENGSPEPVFEFDEDYSYFMVRLPVHAEVLKEVENVGLDARKQVPPQVTPPSNTALADMYA